MDNPIKYSLRAQKFINNRQHFLQEIPENWGKCQINDTYKIFWKGKEKCEGWGYQGPWSDSEVAILEAFGEICKNISWEKIKIMSLREAEFFLRDRNSVVALEEKSYEFLSASWPHVLDSIEQWLHSGKILQNYRFPSGKSFKVLSLPEKIHELKSFFSSEQLSGFYRQGGKIEVLDVEENTVFIALDCAQIPEAALLDWLQMIMAETFREPALNLVPEPFPS
ncbi:MAG: hypothetical protein K2P81_09335 [Bacteriovoracaceae bacterium]|nr:hypothetical protein [Bacteriovoracaceae bacterium]